MERIVVLKNIGGKWVADTIVSNADSISLHLDSKAEIIVPTEPFRIKADIAKDSLDNAQGWATVFGGLAALIGLGITIFQLFKRVKVLSENDKQRLDQINELRTVASAINTQATKIDDLLEIQSKYLTSFQQFIQTGAGTSELVQLEERRMKMAIKPRLFSAGGGYSGSDWTISIRIENKGELATITQLQVIKGEGVSLQAINPPLYLENGKRISFSGRTSKTHPMNTFFKFKIEYKDKENNSYESIFEWNGGRTQILETKAVEGEQ